MAQNAAGWGTSSYIKRSPMTNSATQLATTMTNTGAGVNSSGGISFNNPQQQGAQGQVMATGTPATAETPINANIPANETHVAVEPNSTPLKASNPNLPPNTSEIQTGPPRNTNTPGTVQVDPNAAANAAAVAARNATLHRGATTSQPAPITPLLGGQGNVQANLLDRTKNAPSVAYDPTRTETSPNWLPSTWAPVNNFQQAANTPGDLLQMGMAKGIDPRKYATQAEWYNALLPALGMDAGWAASPRA